MANGIISQSIKRDDPFKDIQGYDPAQATRTQTVAQRVADLSSSGSPLMQLSETKAKQDRNKFGLLNTGGTINQIRKANIEAAMPIAIADDQADAAYDLSNRDAKNTSYEFTAGEGNRARSLAEQGNQDIRYVEKQGIIQSQLQSEGFEQDVSRIGAQTDSQSQLQAERAQIDQDLQAADAATRASLLERQGEIDTELTALAGQQRLDQMKADFGYDEILQQLRGDQAESLTQLETRSNELMQANASAAQTFAASALAIGDILKEPDLTIEAKNALVDKQLQLLESAMAIEEAFVGVPLRSLLTFTYGDIATPAPAPTTDPTLNPDYFPENNAYA